MAATSGLRRLLGMRVWLSLVFVAVCAATATATAMLFLDRFETSFRESAHEIAAGYAVEAAIRIAAADERGNDLTTTVDEVARAPTFVFDRSGDLVSAPQSQGVAFADVPRGSRAVETALGGRRYLGTADDATVVALPSPTPNVGTVVVYARHPDLVSGVGIARETIAEAAVAAAALGALVGIVAAWLVATRLRRIGTAAAAIERGDFDRPLGRGYPDEIGALAAVVDRMRVRLRRSFDTLSSERDRLRRILERLEEGVVTVDAELRVEFANAAARRLIGGIVAEGEPLPGTPMAQLLGGLARRLFAEGTPLHTLVEEDERICAVAGLPPDGLDTAVLVVADVSERERRERAERNFVANAAHELRTPLQTILGSVEALRSGASDDPEDAERFLAHVEREAARLARLTRSLLILARAQTREEAPAVEPVDISSVVENVVRNVRPNDGVTIDARAAPGVVVAADPELLEQAVLNLAANAVRHTTGGTITIVAERHDEGRAVVEIRDTGSGIPPNELGRAFDRFHRGNGRSGDGFGLGLAIARDAVEAIGGTIELESTPEVGTTARITIPLVKEELVG